MMHKAWSSIEEVPYYFWKSSVKFQGHTALKLFEFDPNWAFQDCNSSLNSPMSTKWCTKLEIAWKRCPIVFEGHPLNFKVTRLKKSSNLTQIGRFRTVTPVLIHWWLWNAAQSLKQHRIGALWFLAATKQLYKWYFPSVRLSVCLSVCHTFFTMFPSSYHHEIFRSYYHGQKWYPCKRSRSEVKGQGHRGQHPT